MVIAEFNTCSYLFVNCSTGSATSALGYLSSTSFSDNEVMFLLGFEDPSSFYRPFRSWTGMAPSEFAVVATLEG
jgi:methylphosphotriester-DNA--protein-cysteine methyltransferase